MVDEHKYCALCANNMHLVVMLIPYIEKELEKGEKIVTIFEESLEAEVFNLINNVSLGEDRKRKLRKINWNEADLLNKKTFSVKNKIVFVKGSYDFIKRINLCLEGEKKIINCLDLKIFEQNSREILESHSWILNTTGVKKISDMFHTENLKKIVY